MSENKEEQMYYEGKKLRENALSALKRMKNKEEKLELTTITYRNGVVVRTNSKELIDYYNKRYGEL